ncbi:MAG: hypothetical protein ACK41T_11995 [Pseudobdellovibrio sp.]
MVRDQANYYKRELSLSGGTTVILLSSKAGYSSDLLITLHGGPESYEGTEIRYLGMYRQLLRMGWMIAILKKINHKYYKLLRKRTGCVFYFQKCNHSPKTFKQSYFRYRSAFLWLLKMRISHI